jgi:hypothetical protein
MGRGDELLRGKGLLPYSNIIACLLAPLPSAVDLVCKLVLWKGAARLSGAQGGSVDRVRDDL